MAKAIGSFLTAAGIPVTGDLARTPERVAQAWTDDFLDGYRSNPFKILGELHGAPDAGLVCVTGIDFHSTCPHHLLPYRGIAHLAYLPSGGADGRVAGFSRLAALVDCLAHRLILQETLAQSIAEVLAEAAHAQGAGCILEADQACLSCRGETKAQARVVVSAFVGALAEDPVHANRLYAAIASGRRAPRELAP